MTTPHVLAIDQGSSNTKAVLVSAKEGVICQASNPMETRYPNPGWAEQDANEIWTSVQSVISEIVAQAGDLAIEAIAIANQRETLVVWDARTSQPICPAITWQCRRTAETCANLIADGHDAAVTAATGLQINPLFPASKLAWVMEHVPEARLLAQSGDLRAGTVDSWLLWNLTGGRSFATDHSNASRTQLFDTQTLKFSVDLCSLFGAPLTCLPKPVASDSRFGETVADATALAAGTPILAMMGDSHAALYGHGVRGPGTVKATFGTGSSLMALSPQRSSSCNGLSSTIAWTAKGTTHYALEGNITVSAQAASFAASLLGLAGPAELSDLAQTVDGNAGVVFVPALAGLGAPHWDDHATGTITGMRHDTKPAHIAQATLEAIAHQIADVFEAMEADSNADLQQLRADGGATSNRYLMQLQADILGREVLRADMEEVGAMGVAAMAFETLKCKTDYQQGAAEKFSPGLTTQDCLKARAQWAVGLRKARLV